MNPMHYIPLSATLIVNKQVDYFITIYFTRKKDLIIIVRREERDGHNIKIVAWPDLLLLRLCRLCEFLLY